VLHGHRSVAYIYDKKKEILVLNSDLFNERRRQVALLAKTRVKPLRRKTTQRRASIGIDGQLSNHSLLLDSCVILNPYARLSGCDELFRELENLP
jgi:hypothetical protein